MAHTRGALRWAANFVALSAVLYVVVFGMSGLGSGAWWMLIAALVHAVFAFGLMQGWRWFGYVAFIALFIGISIAASNIWAFGGLSGWIFAAIAAVECVAVLALFASLWKTPSTAS